MIEKLLDHGLDPERFSLTTPIGLFVMINLYGGFLIGIILSFSYWKLKNWLGFSYNQAYVFMTVIALVAFIIYRFKFDYLELTYEDASVFVLWLFMGYALNYLNNRYLDNSVE